MRTLHEHLGLRVGCCRAGDVPRLRAAVRYDASPALSTTSLLQPAPPLLLLLPVPPCSHKLQQVYAQRPEVQLCRLAQGDLRQKGTMTMKEYHNGTSRAEYCAPCSTGHVQSEQKHLATVALVSHTLPGQLAPACDSGLHS